MLHSCHMGNTLTIRLPEDLARWLADVAERTGMSQGQVVRQHLEEARAADRGRPFLRLAGSVTGPRGLSGRKGFATR